MLMTYGFVVGIIMLMTYGFVVRIILNIKKKLLAIMSLELKGLQWEKDNEKIENEGRIEEKTKNE